MWESILLPIKCWSERSLESKLIRQVHIHGWMRTIKDMMEVTEGRWTGVPIQPIQPKFIPPKGPSSYFLMLWHLSASARQQKAWFLTGGIPAALAAKADVLCGQPKLRPPLQYMGFRRLNIMCLAGFKVNVLLTDANTSIHDKYTKEKSNVIIIVYRMSNNKIIHETYSFI